MSRKTYSPDQKAAALVHVQRNGGDIPATSLQIGIPERTLYTWCRRWYAENQRQHTPPPPSPNPVPTFPDQREALDFVRSKIMAELVRLASDLETAPMFTSPYQRVLMLSQLSDRLAKLDAHFKLYQPPPEITTYEVTDSEGEEPNGDEIIQGLVVMIENENNHSYSLVPADLPDTLEYYQRYGKSPRIIIQYWRENDDLETGELEWSGTLTLHEADHESP